MDMLLRNGKVVQPSLEPGAGMPNVVVTSKETGGQPTEPKRIDPTGGVGRQIPRNRDRDAGGHKDYEMNQAWMEAGMAEAFRQFATHMALGLRSAPPRAIGHEDSRNMRNFLDLVELDFVERGIEARQWGKELKRYLTGDTLGYWLYSRRTETPLTDWEYEAAVALATAAARWTDSYEERLRFQKDLEDAKYRWTNGEREPGLQRERTSRGTRWNDATETRCFECSGRGHGGRDCPLRKGVMRRNGETCSSCATCAVATGPNSIPVSPDWGKTLLAREEPVNAEGRDVGENPQPLAVQSHSGTTPLPEEGPTCKRDLNSETGVDAAEGDRPQDTRTQEPQWWREHGAPEDTTSRDTLCSVGMTAILRVEVAGIPGEALLDTGASRSTISPGAVERLQVKVWRLPDVCVFTVANGAQLRIDRVVKGLTMWCGATRLSGDFLVGHVPYDLVVGLDWLTNHRVAWYFQSDKLRTYVKGQWCDLPLVRTNDAKLRSGSTQGRHQRTPEDGKNMRHFLDLVGLEFIDLGIRAQYMTQKRMAAMMANNVSQGDHNAYSVRLAAIVAQEVTMTPDQLVGFYLANLPEEQCRVITQGGMRKFTEWQEVAAALAASEAPWKATYEEWLPYQQQLADARHRAENGEQKRSPRREVARGGYLRDDNTEARCYECRGKGHLGRDFSPNWRQRLIPKGSRDTPGEDSRHTPSTSEESPAPPRTTEEQSGPATGRCEESAPKHTRGITQWNEDERTADIYWWREGTPLDLAHEGNGSLCGLLDTGASRSFISPAAIERLGLRVCFLPKACAFTAANGEVLHMDRVVTRLPMICGGECFTGDFLVGPIPYDVILGLDWLITHRVAWCFQSDKLLRYVNGRWCELPAQRKSDRLAVDTPATEGNAKTPADRAYDVLAQQVSCMTAKEAATLLRPPPKRCKSRHRAGERVKIKDLLRKARNDTQQLKRALDGLHFIEALPEAEAKGVAYLPTERQGPLMCATVEHHRAKSWSPDVQSAVVAAPLDADTEASPWPTAKLEYTEFDAWSQGRNAPATPADIHRPSAAQATTVSQ
ncbi:hypothetical protein EPH_0018880 [Eimeria praecox]|uniref:CCHC-type domain-containing protein n=1 Tax=Eimeria praecox TaxID=51316 RepID=U6H416_9EIME|nr:hypothetical protein EPH_0018880 [Eimeria praecox]